VLSCHRIRLTFVARHSPAVRRCYACHWVIKLIFSSTTTASYRCLPSRTISEPFRFHRGFYYILCIWFLKWNGTISDNLGCIQEESSKMMVQHCWKLVCRFGRLHTRRQTVDRLITTYFCAWGGKNCSFLSHLPYILLYSKTQYYHPHPVLLHSVTAHPTCWDLNWSHNFQNEHIIIIMHYTVTQTLLMPVPQSKLFGNNFGMSFYGPVPFLSPNQQCQSTKRRVEILDSFFVIAGEVCKITWTVWCRQLTVYRMVMLWMLWFGVTRTGIFCQHRSTRLFYMNYTLEILCHITMCYINALFTLLYFTWNV